ncbi:hypothetical protein CFIICLFH_4995 [Methylobacterium goesingense]|nr:hypothetical protein CFIICLFH_4995 [Methylobacterium goesingense]
MSWGWILTSTASWSASGTISMAGSAGVTRPPTVWTVIWWTTPAWGLRISTRFSWSSAATRFSRYSDHLPRISAKSLPVSVRMSPSICRICNSVSAILPRAEAVAATSWPRSPSRRAASRSRALTRASGTRFLA